MTPQQKYYQKNRDKILEEGRNRYYQNIDNEKARAQSYYKNNKKSLKEKRKLRAKIKRQTDPCFKLRSNISRMIRRALLKQQNTKKNSFLKNIGYTLSELKSHLESKFEFWMNWNNLGVYNPKTWNDQDPKTWVWQLDHIIPQSKLLYSSMNDDNFKKCWALENLQPLSAKSNFLKGNKNAM